MGVLIILLWISFLGLFWAYLGYPISLVIINKIKKNKRIIFNNAEFPKISFIITAHNEEKRIRNKLENTLKLNYPKEKMEIIVASDGSTDNTNEIVKDYNVKLLEISERSGKENAQKRAVQEATGEILVFSDVSTILEPKGIKEIVKNFADPRIGCVSSEDRVISKNGEPSGEGAYVKYEMWLRRLESQVNSVVGLSGSFFAARREVCKDFSEKLPSDFRTLLNSIRLGMKGISEPNAIGYYQDVADESKEFQRKIRTVVRGLMAFFSHLELLNVFKYGLFSYQLFCHKLLRWLVPFFLILAYFSNAFLISEHLFYRILFIIQSIFYFFAFLGFVFPRIRNSIIIKIPTYFVIVNFAILVAWYKYLKGERIYKWKPSER